MRPKGLSGLEFVAAAATGPGDILYLLIPGLIPGASAPPSIEVAAPPPLDSPQASLQVNVK